MGLVDFLRIVLYNNTHKKLDGVMCVRNRAWRRDKNYLKAKRKQKIDKEVSYFCYTWFGHGYYNNLHQYSKNKIHCSCSYCSAKTRNKGKRRLLNGNYSPSINYKISDQRKIDNIKFQIENY